MNDTQIQATSKQEGPQPIVLQRRMDPDLNWQVVSVLKIKPWSELPVMVDAGTGHIDVRHVQAIADLYVRYQIRTVQLRLEFDNFMGASGATLHLTNEDAEQLANQLLTAITTNRKGDNL